MLVARRMQAKRDKKFRSRKQRLQGDVKCTEGSGVGQLMDKVQKKVSFLWCSQVPDYRDNLQTHLCPSTIMGDTPRRGGRKTLGESPLAMMLSERACSLLSSTR